MNPSILIIDDDVVFQHNLGETLQDLGYAVETASKGIDGFWKAYRIKPDLIILDVMLPEMDGWEICQRFREMTNTPILFLTSLGGEEDMVKGLGLGGDDYLVKPASMRVLEARVKALLRRGSSSNGSEAAISQTIQYEGLIIDIDRHEVRLNDQRIDLTPIEFKLLTCLVNHQGRALPRDFLLRQVWGEGYCGQPSELWTYISYLRHKIEADPAKPEFIQTVRGHGYRFGDK